ncbi:MAG: tetratricopeptide repeat protein [Chthoniobacterales bacterium]
MQPLNNLGWAAATSPDPAVRNPTRALSLAESAMKESRGKDPGVLRTLAAAYAANERFDDATKTLMTRRDSRTSILNGRAN